MMVGATLRHALRIAAALEPVLRLRVESHGIDARRQLRDFLEQSSYARAWVQNGECLAIGGVVGTIMSSQGLIWLSFAPAARRRPKMLVRNARLAIRELLDLGYRRLTALILADNARDLRFAEAMGFRVGPPIESTNGIELREAVLEPAAEPAGPPFLIYALPRSRTAWLSRFLTYGGWTCHHDRSITLRSFEDVARFFAQPRVGAAETGVAPGWHLINEAVPGIKSVVVRRPVDEVMASLREVDREVGARYDYDRLARMLEYMDRCLDRIARQPGVLAVEFADLQREDVCREIFEFCLPHPFDRGWWQKMNAENVQIDVGAQLAYFRRHALSIDAFKRDCKSRLRSMARDGLVKRRA